MCAPEQYMNKSLAVTLIMLQQAYGGWQGNGKSLVYAWHKHFHVGHKSVDNDLRSGHPSMSTNEESVQHVREIMRTEKNLWTNCIRDWNFC